MTDQHKGGYSVQDLKAKAYLRQTLTDHTGSDALPQRSPQVSAATTTPDEPLTAILADDGVVPEPPSIEEVLKQPYWQQKLDGVRNANGAAADSSNGQPTVQ